MWCPKCQKNVVSNSRIEERGEYKGDENFGEIPEGSKPKVTVHTCSECNTELEGIELGNTESLGDEGIDKR